MSVIKLDTIINEDQRVIPTNCDIIHTKININQIEKIVTSILDKTKYNDVLKYYFNITENLWGVSFKVDMSQFQQMCDSMFIINLYKDNDNNAVLAISKEIHDFPQWSDVETELFKIK